MRFIEINLFGIYIAPISVILVAAWMVSIGLNRVAAKFGLFRHVRHSALFVSAVYTTVS